MTSAGKELKYTQTNQVIEIDPGKLLDPGETDSLKIGYSGTINESFCYPNYSDNIKETPYRIAIMNVNKRQAFLTGKYVLLTPETYWYPVCLAQLLSIKSCADQGRFHAIYTPGQISDRPYSCFTGKNEISW